MEVNKRTLKELFQKDIRYEIPTFQRSYVWERDNQWEPLWVDVCNTAERYREMLAKEKGNHPLAEENTGKHFMGAVVLQQELTPAAELEIRTVIDGQQRLISVQILLDAARKVLKELDFEGEAEQLSRMVRNVFATGDEIFKVWPSNLDREPYRTIMSNDSSAVKTKGRIDRGSLILQASDFFQLQIRDWLTGSSSVENQLQLVKALNTTLFGLLELVVIDLGASDDAYIIFETLNARGTPLRASDLIKNFVLQTAEAQGLSPDELHEATWKKFEDKWWLQDIRQGRITRIRLDVFLNYWLIMTTATEVQTHEVFSKFQSYVKKTKEDISIIVNKIINVASTYKELETEYPTTHLGMFLYRWKIVEAGTATPLLLWLFSQSEQTISRDERFRAIGAIDSFLVRRMICRMTTKDYNKLFMELMVKLHSNSQRDAASTIVEHLASQTADSRIWPNDRLVGQAILKLPLYRYLTRRRLRMILEMIEIHLRGELAEESLIKLGKLTIEHILPRAWQDHWPLDKGIDNTRAEIERDEILHTLGNLTLVSKKLNPTLSNGPWNKKKTLIDEHTVFHLNRDLIKNYENVEWSESTIKERSLTLARAVTEIWKPPPLT